MRHVLEEAPAGVAIEREALAGQCGDVDVLKAPMAPNVGAKGNRREVTERPRQMAAGVSPEVLEVMHKLAEMQAAALQGSQWVGDRFAEESRAIHYGESGGEFKGLGDPTGVQRHTRPVTSSVSKWAAEIACDPAVLALVSKVLDELDPADLATLGYPREKIVAQLEEGFHVADD